MWVSENAKFNPEFEYAEKYAKKFIPKSNSRKTFAHSRVIKVPLLLFDIFFS